MTTVLKHKYLHFVDYSTLLLWDIKRYFATQVLSSFPIVHLGDYINEESAKYSISDSTKTYGILGVNNKDGIFDAYEESGSKIKQKYKKMQIGWIAYNPYRVNVGSIGIRTNENKYEYISPAYVVFSCKSRLLPDFLFLLLKTDFFNKIIRDNTTGSVRQNLNFSVLSNLGIPLPSLEEQNAIVAAYNESFDVAKQYEKQADEKEDCIQQYIAAQLGINNVNNTSFDNGEQYSYLRFYHLKDILRWDCYNQSISTQSKFYQTITLSNLIVEKPKYGAGYKASSKLNEIRYIRITDINEDGTLNEDFVSADQYDEQYLLKQDDFLIARSGNTVGKTFLYDDTYGNAIYAGYLIKFVLDKSKINPQYLLAYTKSKVFKQWIQGNMRVSAQPNINSQQYLEAPIIVPPMDVQNKIVVHISELKEQIKSLRALAATTRNEAIQQFEKTIFE